MSEAHSNQMVYLLIFIGILLISIFGVIVASSFKKKSTQPLKTITEAEPASPAEISVSEVSLKQALKNTEESFFGRIKKAFQNSDKKIVLEQIEEILYTSDLGVATVEKLLAAIDSELSTKEMASLESVKAVLKNQMTDIFKIQNMNQLDTQLMDLLTLSSNGPTVVMIVGVNGAGKTTSIGKLASQLAMQNKKVLVAAGDTFRAAAGGQLKEWTDRAKVEIYWPDNTTDPSAVAFDAVAKAKNQNFDFVLIDTAGRLHTQSHLMEELKKVKRVMTKVIPEAPHNTWIVLDANSGQNALLQAKEFHQALGLTGVVLTKMDGTAKGGVALAIVDQMNLQIKLIGVGEKINDLRPFHYSEYIDSILG